MAKLIAVANQKGGVGKTTTSVNLSACLAQAGQRVLLVDMDAQGNASMGVGVDKAALKLTGCDVLLGERQITDAIMPVCDGAFHLLPSNADMTAAEVGLRQRRGGELALTEALRDMQSRFDYIIADCPPALSMLTVNALAACQGILIPMQCEYYALEGLSALLDTVEKVRAVINPNLEIEGLLRTMYDPRNRLSGDVSSQLVSHFGEQVYDTIIPRNVRLAEAPSHGLPAIEYDASASGAQAYQALAAEVLNRNNVRRKADVREA